MADLSELNGVKYLKSHAQIILDRACEPNSMWFLSLDYFSHVHTLSTNRHFYWKIPKQNSRVGGPEISHMMMFYWFEPVLCLDPVCKFHENSKKPGCFVCYKENIGDSWYVLIFKILKNDNYSVTQKCCSVCCRCQSLK
jgi:hypothetical protein